MATEVFRQALQLADRARTQQQEHAQGEDDQQQQAEDRTLHENRSGQGKK
jgi:hypothetical protein